MLVSSHCTVTLNLVVAEAVATISLGVLGVGGVAKLVDPEPTSGALQAAGLPSSPFLTRVLGLAEVAVAVAALAIGGVLVVAAAFFYLAFTIFTAAAVRGRFPLQSCGCFGREETPPTGIHVAFNAVAAASLVLVALSGSTPVPWEAPVAEVVLYLGLGGVGAYAAVLILTRLPIALKAAGP